MMPNFLNAAIPKIKYLLVLLAIALIVILCIVQFMLGTDASAPTTNRLISLGTQVIPNFIAALVVFSTIYFFLERRGIILNMDQASSLPNVIKQFHSRHDKMDWGPVISTARTLDIVVFYYGSWVRDNEDSFIQFFKNGGKLRLIMSDPCNADLMEDAHHYFFENLSPERLQEKIFDTEDVLQKALIQSGSRAACVDVFYFDSLLHYSVVLANNRFLHLSMYEQFRNTTVKASVFEIDLDEDQWIGQYWRNNIGQFIDRSRRVELCSQNRGENPTHLRPESEV